MRVVSVLPSATEIVCALGLRGSLVGRSEECDYPPSVRELPVVMHARSADTDRASAEIDVRVQAARRAGASLYTLDVATLAALRPDVILTQDLCGVCSVTTDEVADGCARAGVSPRIVTLTPRTLADVWASAETIGASLGVPERGQELASGLRTRSMPGSAGDRRPRVAVVEWVDPPILAGLWVPEMIGSAGGDPVGPAPGEVGERTTWPEVADRHPDLVIVSPCSFSVERTRAELRASRTARGLLRLRPPLGTWILDESYFSRPGPRLANGVALLRALVRRELAADGGANPTWMPLLPPVAEEAA
ncbi:MAG TPA: cobalamin-binding protein [Thermoplasmata archaeon]|nr:cobalamin-binding protein [Thermoplasmata archaeon]